MVQPFLDCDSSSSKPGGMHARNDLGATMIVTVSVRVRMLDEHGCRLRVQEEVAVKGQQAAVTHPEAAEEEHGRHAERTQTLNLAKAGREAVGRGLDAPGNGCKGENVGCKIRDAVNGICDHGLGIEGVAADALGNGHAKVRVQTEPGDSNTSVILVLRGQVDIVVMMVVAVVAAVAASLLGRAHDG